MARLREIKKWGNSLVLVFNATDSKDLGIEEGHMIDIEDLNLNKEGEGDEQPID